MSADLLGSFLESNDGLSKLAHLFSKMGGRELSPEALQCISFLRNNGSNDVAVGIIEDKMYQLSVDDLTKMTREISAATAHEKMLEAQAANFQKGGM